MPHRRKAVDNIRYVDLIGLKPDSRDQFKLGFDPDVGLVCLVREERDWIGLKKVTRKTCGGHPFNEDMVRDYFERHGISKSAYEQKVMPLLNNEQRGNI